MSLPGTFVALAVYAPVPRTMLNECPLVALIAVQQTTILGM